MGGRFLLIAGLVLPLFTASLAWSAEEGTEFFERRIRPLLAEHCYECHGAETQEHHLRLDQAGEMFAGGKSGPAIVPGKPDGSLLITAVRYTDDDLQMPPDQKLSAEQIADLVKWIELGAPHPDYKPGDSPPKDDPRSTARNADWEKRANHWSFQPLIAPPLPSAQNQGWVQTSIDAFILSRLEEKQLKPAAAADKRTLLRRVTYDLTGLPPTPAEVEAFLQDTSADAFARVVERLLESPRYGERWGRHWLDVARYADSNGLDENLAHGNAWRYRDWVIHAFNQDMPYDEFIRWQVAGDLLTADDPLVRNQQLTATGFLVLGPKVLAEVDERKMEMDIIDEQIDTLGKSVLGLTLGCARCHDHKFDPITTYDYYALAGIFKSTHTMDSFTKIAKWHEHPLHDAAYEVARADFDKELQTKKQSVESAVQAATQQLQQELGAGAAMPEKPEEAFPAETKARLKQLRDELAAYEKNAPEQPSAMGVIDDPKIANVAVHIRGSHLTQGEIVPRGIPVVLHRDSPFTVDDKASGRLALANWLTSLENPLTARVIVNRVWRWHFGHGLVETADNFGLLGTKPSQPELLDHLASEFTRDWSLKNLHRRILLSATYQTSSSGAAELLAADPENQLLGRTTLQRLEAEEIRDAILAVSGQLDLSPGGPALATKNRAHIFDHTSKDDTTYAYNRRSVFLPVIRNHLHESFTLFDYSNASVANGNRSTSTVTSQALYLMNGDFIEHAAELLAAELLKREDATDSQRLQTLYERTLSRPATANEIERALQFLGQIEQQSSRAQGWQLLCQNVLISNEFFYLR